MKPGRRYPEIGPFKRIWAALNESNEGWYRTRPMKGLGIRTHETTQGTIISAIPQPAAATTSAAGIKRCTIVTTHDNYLDCTEFESGDAIQVAIPFYGRASTYTNLTLGSIHYFTSAGQIRASSTGNDSHYVVKELSPPYAAGQDVYAIQPTGKTDVTVAGVVLEWMDVHLRRMETLQVELPMCRLEGGVVTQRHVIVEGGPIY